MAHVDSASVSKAITICVQAVEALDRTSQALMSKYQAAGSGWKDAKYKELGAIVSEAVSALRNPIGELQNCQGTLQQVQSAISDYEDISLN